MDTINVRKGVKKRRPTFARHEAGQKKRVGDNWRKPRGRQNKMRLNKAGHKVQISQGYRMPRLLRHHSTHIGLAIVHVRTMADMESIDAKKQCVIIASSVGMRKKQQMLDFAQEHKIQLVNIRDVDAYKKAFDVKRQELADRRKAKEQSRKARQQVKTDKKSVKDKTQKETKDVSALEQKAQEESKESDDSVEKRKQQEKILHHKE